MKEIDMNFDVCDLNNEFPQKMIEGKIVFYKSLS